MSKYHYNGPEIDHIILSPSGHCSKRAREAALKREHDRIFPPGFWNEPEPTEEQQKQAKAQLLLASAANLRELANRGMTPRKFRKAADKMEAEAHSLLEKNHD